MPQDLVALEERLGKAELGTKRACPSCGSRFYDLNKSPVACPGCAHEFVPDEGGRNRRARQSVDPVAVKPAEKERVAETVEDEVLEADDADAVSDDDNEDDDVLEDASDLGGDDDMAEVIDKVGPEKDDG